MRGSGRSGGSLTSAPQSMRNAPLSLALSVSLLPSVLVLALRPAAYHPSLQAQLEPTLPPMSEGDAPIKPTFVKRSRPRGSAGAGLSASSPASTPIRSSNGRVTAEEEEAEDAGVVRRINTARRSRGDAFATTGKSDKRKSQGIRFDGGQEEEEDGDVSTPDGQIFDRQQR